MNRCWKKKEATYPEEDECTKATFPWLGRCKRRILFMDNLSYPKICNLFFTILESRILSEATTNFTSSSKVITTSRSTMSNDHETTALTIILNNPHKGRNCMRTTHQHRSVKSNATAGNTHEWRMGESNEVWDWQCLLRWDNEALSRYRG